MKDEKKGGFNFVSPWKVLVGDPRLAGREWHSQAEIIRFGEICATLSESNIKECNHTKRELLVLYL